MYSMSQKCLAEAIGTFILVFFGCGAAMAGAGTLGTAVAFGLSIIVAAYTVGKISGAHLNPAVSLAMVMDGRMTAAEFIPYAVSQIVGGFAASVMHFFIFVLFNKENEMGGVSFGANSFGELNFLGALLVEIILTCTFVFVILTVTAHKDEKVSGNAPIFIGLALTFVHLAGIGLTGTSVNPARSIAPAIFGISCTEWDSFLQLWVFIVGPLVGAVVASILYSMLIKDKD